MARGIGKLPKEEREVIWEKIKVYYETGLTYTEIIDNIEHNFDVTIDKGGISRKAEKNNWIKNKIQPLKNDIIDYEKEKTTLDTKKTTLVEKVAKLSDFEITTLGEIIADESSISSLITSTASLALIRTNQLLTKNQTVEKINVGDGVQQFEPRELNATDLKNISDTIDKLSVTTGVNERFSKSSVEVTNNNQNLQPTQILIQRDN